MKFYISLFKTKKDVGPAKYTGFSDFLLNASRDEKKTVFKEVAYKANEEQRKILQRVHATN